MQRALVALVAASSCLTSVPLLPIASVDAAAPAVVVLNELHYHPGDDNPAAEFVELHNTTGGQVDVGGWCISGTGFCFGPGAAIAANGFAVVTGSMYSGALSNGGERIRLRDASGTTVDELTYADAGEWPALADGDGHSLQRRDPLLAGTDPANWLSAPPTIGVKNGVAGTGLIPAWKAVTHTVLPAPGQPLEVTATLLNATTATLIYRVGFGVEVLVPMNVSGTTATASIPGQAAGALVRYRLASLSPTNGTTGTWPRQGDGATYTGTTVATSVTSRLPRFEWFISDATYAQAANDLTLTGDDGYPCVFAYNGTIFDGSKARVKGQVSRLFPKKKWKMVLPAGHTLMIPDVLPEPVDEFALHSSYADKSFLRETLAAEMMIDAGMPASQAFPVRLERNGAFYGLYTSLEQQDGTWRDRYGLDDSVIYEVGGGRVFGLLAAGDANLSQTSLRTKYEKETFEYQNDDALRALIRTTNSLSGTSLRNWISANVNVPSVVNALAASVVIQHQDWGHKNYRLYLDEHGRWGTIPSDYDLVLGRRWSNTLGALDSTVYVGGSFEQPGGPLFAPFWFDPLLSQLVRRRIRELTEQLLDPTTVAARVAQLNEQVRAEAALDRQIWGTYGNDESPDSAGNRIMSSYVTPQFNRILGTFAGTGRVAGTPQPAVPAVRISSVQRQPVFSVPEHVVIANDSNDTVDISGFSIDGIDLVVPGGTVLLAGQSVVFASAEAGSLVGAFSCCLMGGTYSGDIDDKGEVLTLRTPDGAAIGATVDTGNLTPANTQTEIAGLPNRSALVSIVATATAGPGYLQVLPCGAAPGASSNLNTDAAGQTRAALAVVQFDAAGKACIYNETATHVIADLQGYFAPGAFDDTADVRLLDTRSGARRTAGTRTTITGLPNRSAVVSVTATQTAGSGYLQVLACDAAPGGSSNLNTDAAGQTRAVLAVVQFDAAGKACIYNETATHVIADLQGYFAPGAFDDTADVRLLDTRSGAAPASGSQSSITGNAGRSALVSISATGATAGGYLQVLACGTAAGASSNLNTDGAGQTIANLAAVQFGADGRACVFTSASTHIIADLQGYFVAGTFDDVADARLVDTRTR